MAKVIFVLCHCYASDTAHLDNKNFYFSFFTVLADNRWASISLLFLLSLADSSDTLQNTICWGIMFNRFADRVSVSSRKQAHVWFSTFFSGAVYPFWSLANGCRQKKTGITTCKVILRLTIFKFLADDVCSFHELCVILCFTNFE